MLDPPDRLDHSASSVPPRPLPPPSVLERVRTYWEDPRVRVAALLVGAAVAGVFWFRLGAGGGAGSAAAPEAKAPAASAAAAGAVAASRSTTTTAGAAVFVHVAGAVVRPGLVHLAGGSRVADAVSAAGGGLPDADLDRLNLAAKVTDGERVAVAHIGQPAPAVAGGGSGGTPGDGSTGAAGGSPNGPVNLNTATEPELEELPGIGPSFAAAIIAEREKRGGFTSVDQLRDVRGIGEKRFADLKDLVAV